MKLKLSTFFAVSLLFSAGIHADTIDLKCGSKLTGKITQVSESEVKINTDFGGDLTIPLAKINSFKTDTPVTTGTCEHETEKALLSYEPGKFTVTKGEQTRTLDKMQPAWTNETDNPFIEKPKKLWNFSAGLDIGGKTGNSEKFGIAGAVDAVRKTDVDQLKLYSRYIQSKDDGVKSEDELILGVDYEHDISERTAWYLRAEFEKDDIEELNLRSTVASGLGYYFLRDPGHVLRGRAGLSYRNEDYKEGSDNEKIGLDLGLYHKYQFGEWGTLVNDLTYMPSFEDPSDYRAVLDTSLDLPFKSIDGLSLNMGMQNEYTSITPGDTKHLDTTYYLRLKYAW